MSDDSPAVGPPPDDGIEDTPTVSCERCGSEWSLAYELDELGAGNGAVEQFAMDHKRHAGHFPDGVTPWVVDCRYCHAGDEFLRERPAERWARTHARHTDHEVGIEHGEDHHRTVSPTDG